MKNNLTPDLYSLIIKYTDWNSLHSFKKIDRFCYFISKREIEKRKKNNFIDGLKFSIQIDNIELKSISIIDRENTFFIPKNRYSIPCIRNVICDFFIYSFQIHRWILTSKIIKLMIRFMNKTNINELAKFDKEKQILFFKCKNKEIILYGIT